MAITSIKDLKTSRRIGIGWMTISIIGAMLTGLVGIAYYAKNNATLQDPEMVFVTFSNILFHPYITGFLLSAILASIMSSISSQLLVISSAVTEDFYKTFFRRNASDKELVFIGRLSVLVVAMIAVVLAYHPSDTIFNTRRLCLGRIWFSIRTCHFIKFILEENEQMGRSCWDDC